MKRPAQDSNCRPQRLEARILPLRTPLPLDLLDNEAIETQFYKSGSIIGCRPSGLKLTFKGKSSVYKQRRFSEGSDLTLPLT